MKTERLFYQDPGLFQFEARLLRQYQEGDQWIAVLDRTAFYPEGGGQPADKGWLNKIPVIDIQVKDQEIRHFLSVALPDEGTSITGKLNADWRYDFMQQHTGQHIISASLLKACGYQTASVHLGEDYSTVEIATDAITEKEIAAAEDLANKAITENRLVRTFWITRDEIDKFQFRRPPQKKGNLRVVEIEGFDLAACGGIHVSSTGEVGLIQITGIEKIRGRPRLQFKVGRRAYEDCRKKKRLVSRLSQELTCGMEEIFHSVQSLKNTLTEKNRRIGQMEEQLAGLLAATLYQEAKEIGNYRLAVNQYRNESRSLVSGIFKKLLDRSGTLVCLTNTVGNGVQWMVGRSQDVPVSLKEIVPPLLTLFGGKGGGSNTQWQGMGEKPEGIVAFLKALEEHFSMRLS